jgi:hypothetical protein
MFATGSLGVLANAQAADSANDQQKNGSNVTEKTGTLAEQLMS